MLISLLTRMRLTTAGLLAASVPFSCHRKQMELLVGEKARVTRRHVAASTSPDALSALRKPMPKSSRNWELLQTSLFAGRLHVCPMSGTPVIDAQSCSKTLKKALWAGFVAIAKAVNEKDTAEFDTAMETLARLVKCHAGEEESQEEESEEEESGEEGEEEESEEEESDEEESDEESLED